MKRLYFLFFIIALYCSCSSQPLLVLRDGVKLNTLNIYFEPGKVADPEAFGLFEKQLDDFIARHNNSGGLSV